MTRIDTATRLLPAAAVFSLVAITVTACEPFGTVCSAIGYPSVAEITLASPRQGLTLQLCDGEDCVLDPPPRADKGEPVPTSEVPGAQDGGTISVTGNSSTGWSADFIGGQPEIGYRLSISSGKTIAEGSVGVEWVRVGGTEECGGPHEAIIELPA